MKQWLIKILKTIVSDVRQAVVPTILLSLAGGIAGLIFLWQKASSVAVQIAKIPTPLWATIALVLLCCVYIYLKSARLQLSAPTSSKKPKTVYFPIGKYKWETKVYDDGSFEVSKYPFCVKHDLRFIFASHWKYCPGTENEKCDNSLSDNDEFKVYETAKSIIENLVRNKKY